MFSVMPGELVGPGELPVAIVPRALVGLLARVRANVLLEVRGLQVGLVAVGILALEVARSRHGVKRGREELAAYLVPLLLLLRYGAA